jgi:hypothetical protein
VRRVFGPRTVVEAAFLVAVPVGSLAAGLGPYAIVAASAVGYLAVLLLEAMLWRRGAPGVATAASAPVPEAAEPEAAELQAAEPEPEAAEPVPEPEPEPEPAPEAEPAPEPEPARILQPVPDLEPELEPEPDLEPAAEAEPVVVPIGLGSSPRSWNLWDLERLTRESAGDDAVRDEERTFLLMYLREFAGPDGLLPADFDSLVRDSFGDLVGAR